MKKLVFISGILCCSFIGLSQKADLPAPAPDAPGKVTVIATPEDKISKLEAEIASLKASHIEMKKQLLEIQSALPTAKKKKLTVNRAGSKQVNWTTNEE